MGWCTTFDLDRFAAAAGGYLRSRAAENTLLLSAVQAARAAQSRGAAGPAQATAPSRVADGSSAGGSRRTAASRAARSCTTRRRRC